MDEILELLSAAVASANAACPRPSHDRQTNETSTLRPPNRCVYVVATTFDETRHAIAVARVLARGCNWSLAIIVPPRDHVTVSSGRAHVYRLPTDELTSPRNVTEETVRPLIANLDLPAEVMVAPAATVRDLTEVLPPRATVVISGPLGRIVGPSAQRLARKLAYREFNVIFLPYAGEQSLVGTRMSEPVSG